MRNTIADTENVSMYKPELYIIARCPSNDQQLLYIDTRNVDIKDLRHPTMVSGVDLYDIIRCFHGDGPDCQLEAGQQKGGAFPCWICPVNINNRTDIPYVYYQPIMGLTERINKVLNSNTLSVVKAVHAFPGKFSSQNRLSEITQSESQKHLHNYAKFH